MNSPNPKTPAPNATHTFPAVELDANGLGRYLYLSGETYITNDADNKGIRWYIKSSKDGTYTKVKEYNPAVRKAHINKDGSFQGWKVVNEFQNKRKTKYNKELSEGKIPSNNSKKTKNTNNFYAHYGDDDTFTYVDEAGIKAVLNSLSKDELVKRCYMMYEEGGVEHDKLLHAPKEYVMSDEHKTMMEEKMIQIEQDRWVGMDYDEDIKKFNKELHKAMAEDEDDKVIEITNKKKEYKKEYADLQEKYQEVEEEESSDEEVEDDEEE